MAKFDGFEEIKAWQTAYEITLDIYRTSADGSFAKDYGLRDQIRRASVSMMANIAEGHGRRSNTEFANIARGSAAEVQSHLPSLWVLTIWKRVSSIGYTLRPKKFRE